MSAVSLAAMQGPEGTAVVRGRVVDATTGRPVANLLLRFNSRPRGSYTPGIDPQPPDRSAITNADGAFEVPRLAAGDYSIYTANVGEYLSIGYGVTRPGGGSKLLVVGDGARIDITIKAWRGARIEGHVFDERGRPVVGAEVRVFAEDPQVYGSDTTDDRGLYEITRLRPGRYAVGVPIWLSNRTLSAAPGRQGSYASAIYPYLLDRRDRTVLMPHGAPLPALADDGRPQVYVTTFAGGSSTRAGAARYALAAGDARTDVDITLPAVRGVRVAGVVTAPSKVDGTILTLRPEGSTDVDAGRIDATAATDGTFVFVAVPPGRYVLDGYRRNPPLTEVSISAGVPLTAMDDVIDRDPEDAWVRMPLSVGDSDIDDLAIALQRGTPLNGRVVLENEAFDGRSQPRVVLTTSAERYAFSDRYVPIGRDGAFAMRLKPGSYGVLASVDGQGRTFRTAIVNGIDIGYGPLVVGHEPLTDVQFVFGRVDTAVRGAVVDASGQPSESATVVVFPVDRARWFRLDESGVGRALPVRTGRYEITGLPPGDYYLAALDTSEGSLLASTVERLIPGATRIALRSGSPLAQNLVVRPEAP